MNDSTSLKPELTNVQTAPSLNILYQDEYLVAVDKPAGLLVHRSSIDKHETQFLLQLLRDQIGAHVFPVQRLDKPTSGVIVFAKTPSIAAKLQSALDTNLRAGAADAGSAQKQYLLVCRGYTPLASVIDHPLKPINEFKTKTNSKTLPKLAQPAVTQFTRLHTIELDVAIDRYACSRYSLVSAQLLSGRKHQLRRHFKHISHPIIGCPKYGKSVHNRYFADVLGVSRLLLHAHRLRFMHPLTQQNLVIEAVPSGDFAALLKRFQWSLSEPEGVEAGAPSADGDLVQRLHQDAPRVTSE